MKLIYLKITQIIVVVLFFWGILSLFFMGFAALGDDFSPKCPSYSDKFNCISSFEYGPDKTDRNTTKFESILSHVTWGKFDNCETESKVEIVKPSENKIIFNKRVFNKGEQYLGKDYFGLNFWTISFSNYQYLGNIPYCDWHSNNTATPTESKREVLVGSFGTQFSIRKGLLVMGLLIATFIYLTLKIRRLRKQKKKIGFFNPTPKKIILTSIFLIIAIISIILNFLQYTFLMDLMISGFGLFSAIAFRDGNLFTSIILFSLQILYLYIISCIIIFVINYLKD